MGIMNLFKRRKIKKVSQDLNNATSFYEIGKVLDENGLLSVPKDDNHNTFGQRLDTLDENGELPWGWEFANKDFIGPRDGKLLGLHIACSNASNLDDEIKKIQEFIDYYYIYKNECISLGDCYYKHFHDSHMKCSNSRNLCFELVTPKEERLAYIKENYERLKDIEKLKSHLKDNVLDFIKSNNGILQSELIKHYYEELYNDVRNAVKQLMDNNLIFKEKCGRSFKLYIKK